MTSNNPDTLVKRDELLARERRELTRLILPWRMFLKRIGLRRSLANKETEK